MNTQVSCLSCFHVERHKVAAVRAFDIQPAFPGEPGSRYISQRENQRFNVLPCALCVSGTAVMAWQSRAKPCKEDRARA